MRHAKIVTRHAQIVVSLGPELGPENYESDTSLDLQKYPLLTMTSCDLFLFLVLNNGKIILTMFFL
jgi:hypothetical protein